MANTQELPPEQQVSLVQGRDLQRVSEILGNAFTDDPIFQWFNQTSRIYRFLFMAEIDALYKKQGLIYINQSNNRCGAVVARWRFEQTTIPLASTASDLVSCDDRWPNQS